MRDQNQSALVTGGVQGLGAAAAKALADVGVTVAATHLGAGDRARAFADETGIPVFEWDVSEYDACTKGLKDVEEAIGPLDILVNNAGNVIFEDIETVSTEHFRLHLDIHVMGTFFGCKYALPLMKHRHKTIGGGGSSIVNMASTAALMGYGTIPAYTAAKGAISSMTRSIAMHCQDNEYGIRCNALAPGGIETPMVMGVSGRAGEAPMDIPEGPLPADALGHPGDVAGCVLFLASDDARFLNGLTIPVDNGLDARPHH